MKIMSVNDYIEFKLIENVFFEFFFIKVILLILGD